MGIIENIMETTINRFPVHVKSTDGTLSIIGTKVRH